MHWLKFMKHFLLAIFVVVTVWLQRNFNLIFFLFVAITMMCMCMQAKWKGEICRPRRLFEMVKCAWSEIDIEPIFCCVSLSSMRTRRPNGDRT